MKKVNYKQIFYKFLVENGILFQFLELVQKNKLNTLEEICSHTNPKNFIRNGHMFNRTRILTWDKDWKPYHNKWQKLLLELNTKKTKKNEKRN